MQANLRNEGVSVVVRWILLVVFALLLASSQLYSLTLAALLAAGALWNAALTGVLLRGRRLPLHKLVTVLADLGLALALFYVSRTLEGPFVWAALLPIASATLAVPVWLALLFAAAASFGFGAMAAIDVPINEIPAQMLTPTISFAAASVLLSLVRSKPSQAMPVEPNEAAPANAKSVDAVLETANALHSTLVFDQVLDLGLDLAFDALQAEKTKVAGGILLFIEGDLRVAAVKGLPAGALGQLLPGRDGVLAEVLKDGIARPSEQPGRDAEFGSLEGLAGFQSLYCTPLRSGTDLYGAMFIAHSESEFFTEERSEAAELVSKQLMTALQNAQRFEELSAQNERLSTIQRNERKQLARALHDGPSQSVAAIAMRVNLARRLLSKDSGAANEELFKLEDLARRTTIEMRHTLFTLQPQSLEISGLPAALQDLARQAEEALGTKVEMEIDPEVIKTLNPTTQNGLFYIAAEALTNAGKHSRAKSIQLLLAKDEPKSVLLTIADDGVGFDPNARRDSSREGLGLATMRERVELIGGRLRLESDPGQGTRVIVWAPIK